MPSSLTWLLALALIAASPESTGPAVKPVFNRGLYGFQMYWPTPGDTMPFAFAGDLHASMMRVPAAWKDLERERGTWNQEWIDRLHWLIDGYAARNVAVYLQVEGTPEWAASAPYHEKNPPRPEFWTDWERAAKKLATEFGIAHDGHRAVTHFAYGNEAYSMFWPNGPNDHQVKLDKFVEMSRVMADAVHSVGVKYVGPEAGDGRGFGLGDYRTYIREYMKRAGSFTDVISGHAYATRRWYDRLLGYGRGKGVLDEVDDMNAIAEEFGKPLWITEWGEGATSAFNDEQAQAELVYDVLANLANSPRSRLERMFFWVLNYPPQSSEAAWHAEGERGLVRYRPPVLQAKPAYYCFGAFSRMEQVPASAASCPRWRPGFEK